MTLWDRFWRWLTSPRERPGTSRPPEATRLDVAALARELDLDAEARRLGRAGLPATDTAVLSGPEALVVQRIEQARQEAAERASRRLAVIDDDLARHALAAHVQRVAGAQGDFARAASTLVGERRTLLDALRRAAQLRRAELDTFMRRHGLQREADYPSPSGRVLLAGLLVLMVALEGLANAFFFAQGLGSGLVGGFVEAALFAALNVGVAYLFGRVGLRQIAHARPARRLVGLASLAAALVAMAVIALAIAHLRDALAADSADAPAAALRSLRAAPFELAGLASWALAGVSIVFAGTALADGWKSDDPYPGYGRLDRRTRLAGDDHAAELDELRAELESLKDEHLAALDSGLARAHLAAAVTESLLADKRATAERLAHALDDAGHALESLLQRFRTENELARAPAPRPARFDVLPPLAPIALPPVDTRPDEIGLQAQREAIAQLQAGAPSLRAAIQAVLEEVQTSLALDEARPGVRPAAAAPTSMGGPAAAALPAERAP